MADGQQTGDVWFVRGVPVELRQDVKRAAGERGVAIGRVVTEALQAFLRASDIRPIGQAAPTEELTELRGVVAELRQLVDGLDVREIDLAKRVAALEGGRTGQDASEPAEAPKARQQHQKATGSPPKAFKLKPDEEAAARLMADIQASDIELFTSGPSGDAAGRRLTVAGEDAVRRLYAVLPSYSGVARLIGSNKATVKRVIGATR